MTTDETIRAHVLFRKQVSDGNYGSETAEVLLEVPLDRIGVPAVEYVAATLETARRLVHEELSKSPAWRVRDAVQPELPMQPAPKVDPEDLPL